MAGLSFLRYLGGCLLVLVALGVEEDATDPVARRRALRRAREDAVAGSQVLVELGIGQVARGLEVAPAPVAARAPREAHATNVEGALTLDDYLREVKAVTDTLGAARDLFERIARFADRHSPQTLFARALIIIVVPMLLLQALSAWWFYSQRGDNVTNRLAILRVRPGDSRGGESNYAFVVDVAGLSKLLAHANGHLRSNLGVDDALLLDELCRNTQKFVL